MAKLRFPNPGSDIDRMVHVFAVVASEARSRSIEIFDLDFMTDVVAGAGQASSQGAAGALAVARSRRADRSRDPLYNQLKMYSEIYRMLGWLRPSPASRLRFKVTLLGETLAFDAEQDIPLRRGIVRESLLAVVFPNETTENFGVASSRPFSWLLQLAEELGGVVNRHEMILGLLAITDDRVTAVTEVANEVLKLREGKVEGLYAAVEDFAAGEGIQRNTLENYTRFPVGVLSSGSIGWGVSKRIWFHQGVRSHPTHSDRLLRGETVEEGTRPQRIRRLRS